MSNVEKLNIVIGAKDQASSTLKRIQSSVLSIGAAYMSWRVAKDIIGGIVKAGIASETIWNDVAASLDRHGFAVDSNLKKIQAFGSELQDLTGISDELTGVAIQAFLDYNNDLATSLDLVKVAADLAAGGHMDMRAAVDLVGKASVGYTGTLSRYGIIIDESIPKQEKFKAALEQINQRFGGAAAARMDATAGKVERLDQTFGDLQETLFRIANGANSAGSAVDGLTGMLKEINRQAIILEKTESFWEKIGLLLDRSGMMKIGLEVKIANREKYEQELKDMMEWARGLNKDAPAPELSYKDQLIAKAYEEIAALEKATAAQSAYKLVLNEILGIAVPEPDFYEEIADEIITITSKTKQAELRAINENAAAQMVLYDIISDQYEASSEDRIKARAREMVANNQMTANEANVWKNAERNKIILRRNIQSEMISITDRGAQEAARKMVDAFWGVKVKLKDVWEGMAKDFLQYFIEELLKAIAAKFVVKLLQVIGFDNPANDALAYQSGRDYAKYFQAGHDDEILYNSAPRLSGHSSPSPVGTVEPGGNVYNFYGFTPTDANEYVRNVVGPQLIAAANNNEINLVTTDNLNKIKGRVS